MTPELLALFEDYGNLIARVITKLETIVEFYDVQSLVKQLAEELEGDALEAQWITNEIHMQIAKSTILKTGNDFISVAFPDSPN